MTDTCQAVSYLIPHGNTYYHLCFAYEETKAQSHLGHLGFWGYVKLAPWLDMEDTVGWK